METTGYLEPTTTGAARTAYDELEPIGRELVREVAVAMGFDRDAYRSHVTDDVVATAHDALFAGLLEVHIVETEGFATVREGFPAGVEVSLEGPEHVDHVAWHHAKCADRVVAVTFQDQRDAAVSTVRRMAWGMVYRELVADH